MIYNFHVKKAFNKYLISCLLASIGTALGTFVDAIIVGNLLGQNALAVVNISMPVYLFYETIGFTIGVGAGINISNNIGNGNKHKAQSCFSKALTLSLAVSVLVVILALLFNEQIIHALGGGEGIYDLSRDYILPVLLAAPIFIMLPVISLGVRNDAAPFLVVIAQNVYAVTNLVLDLVFIGMFKTGIIGAAIAIIIGQFLAILVCISHFFIKKNILKLRLSLIKSREALRLIFNGGGYGLTFLFQFIVIIIFNNILANKFGVTEVAVYSILFSVSMFAYIFFDGISMAISPLIATFFGEKNKKDIIQTMKFARKKIIVFSIMITVLIFVFAKYLTYMFGITDGLALDLSITTLRIYSISIIFICINYSMIVYLQSIARSTYALVISTLRGLVLLAPIGAIFAYNFGARGIAISFIIVEAVVTLITFISLLVVSRKNNSNILLISNEESNDIVFEAVIDNSKDSLENTVSELEKFCEDNGIDPAKNYFINLIVEELVVKIFTDGFKVSDSDDKKNYINIKIFYTETLIKIYIRDDAVNYNPFDNDVDDLDNMGIEIVKNKAKEFSYQRKLVFNQLYIEL